jgi:glycosyltransferase involved in cell wall biosynthesis
MDHKNDKISDCKIIMIKSEIAEIKSEDKINALSILDPYNAQIKEGGLRTKGILKQSLENKPLFSVVTVTFNSNKFLKNAIISIINQTYDNIEFIIIDGGSTDGTINIIKKYEDKIDYWISEPDKGIYDAMNKGIDFAKGEWIAFLNSDDIYSSNNTIDVFANAICKNPTIELFYGKVAVIEKGRFLYYAGRQITSRDYWYPTKCMCHQAIFFKREVFNRFGKFEIIANGGISDNIWLVNFFYFQQGKALFINEVVSNFSCGGYYEQHGFEAYWALVRFANKRFPFLIRLRFYIRLPELLIKFKVFQLHKDTAFRKWYRNIKYKVMPPRS